MTSPVIGTPWKKLNAPVSKEAQVSSVIAIHSS